MPPHLYVWAAPFSVKIVFNAVQALSEAVPRIPRRILSASNLAGPSWAWASGGRRGPVLEVLQFETNHPAANIFCPSRCFAWDSARSPGGPLPNINRINAGKVGNADNRPLYANAASTPRDPGPLSSNNLRPPAFPSGSWTTPPRAFAGAGGTPGAPSPCSTLIVAAPMTFSSPRPGPGLPQFNGVFTRDRGSRARHRGRSSGPDSRRGRSK